MRQVAEIGCPELFGFLASVLDGEIGEPAAARKAPSLNWQ
jgi:hypothetical protein